MTRLFALLAGLALLVFPDRSPAGLVTYTFEATVDSVSPAPQAPGWHVAVGTQVTGILQFDSDTPPSSIQGDTAQYLLSGLFRLDVQGGGSISYTTFGAGVGSHGAALSGYLFASPVNNRTILSLVDSQGLGGVTSNHLPAGPLDLSKFPNAGLLFRVPIANSLTDPEDQPVGSGAPVLATITSFTYSSGSLLTTPEPSSFTLMALGAAGLAGYRRRRNRNASV